MKRFDALDWLPISCLVMSFGALIRTVFGSDYRDIIETLKGWGALRSIVNVQ
jgi:hypothetical protein